MNDQLNETADVIDKDLREAYRIPEGTATFDFLTRNVRTDDPESFASNTYVLVSWLLPRLTRRTHPLFDQVMALLDELDEAAIDPNLNETAVVIKREQVMTLFGEIHTMHRLEPMLAAQDAFKQSQSARASKPRARLEEDARMIAKAYWVGHTGRAERGRVKELAREYGVTEATVRNYANKYKPD